MWFTILSATLGVTLGTLVGNRVLGRIPDIWFHRVLAGVLALLGIAMMTRGVRS
jgi:uncharacterized membrane protein YfcA